MVRLNKREREEEESRKEENSSVIAAPPPLPTFLIGSFLPIVVRVRRGLERCPPAGEPVITESSSGAQGKRFLIEFDFPPPLITYLPSQHYWEHYSAIPGFSVMGRKEGRI